MRTASNDVLIYGAPGTTLRELRWVSRDGETVGRASEPVDAWDLRIAPDGRRVAITEVDPQLRTLDVFIRSGSQPVGTRLSLSTDADESGVWSPDGLRIAWAGRRRSVMIRGAGAVLPEQTIATFRFAAAGLGLVARWPIAPDRPHACRHARRLLDPAAAPKARRRSHT